MTPSHYLDQLQPFMGWLHQHTLWAGCFTFLVAFTESLMVVGYIIPGSVMLAAIGTLVGAGVLPFLTVYLWALAGAIAGDGVSYGFGLQFKERIPQWWPFSKYPQWLQSGETFFAAHGGKSVFLGRFVGPIRPIIPVIAGMLKMPRKLFFLSNISSAILWAPLYMLPGMLLGAASSQLEPRTATRVLIMSLLLLLLIGLFFTVIKWLYSTLKSLCNRRFNALWRWLNQLKQYQWLMSLIQDARHRHNHRQLNLISLWCCYCLLFFGLTLYIALHGSGGALNQAIHHGLRSLWNETAAQIMLTITFMGEKTVTLSACFLVMIYLAFRKQWRALILLGFALCSALSVVYVMKYCINSPRPWGVWVMGEGHSYPSGHSTLAVTAYSFLALLVGRELQKEHRWIPYSLTTLLCIAIMGSRLYLGQHWLTDVVGGALLGLIISIGATLLYRQRDHKPLAPWTFVLVSLLSTILTTGIYSYYHVKGSLHQHAPLWPQETHTREQWWQTSPTASPLLRNNIMGQPKQLFNIQWVEHLDSIKKQLEQLGWNTLEGHNNIERLNRLFANKPQNYLPVFSFLYQGKAPVLIMTKKNTHGKLLVLRLWAGNITLTDTQAPLWLGNITLQDKPLHHFWQWKKKNYSVNATPAIAYLNLPAERYHLRKIPLQPHQYITTLSPCEWRGGVLLIQPVGA